MSPTTSALLSYWQRLPSESPSARRKSLDAIRERVRAGLESRAALVPFALGDVDDGIVAAATQAYIETDHGPVDVGASCDAIEWVRRGLALNRGAVFGALLAAEDEHITERLGGLRLVLSATEIEAVGRVVGPSPGPRASAFLGDWLDLVADGPLHRERLALCAIVEGERRARAA
jgi:hypothetical protein